MSGTRLTFASAKAWLDHYSIPVTESGCFLFTGGLDKKGYGKVGVNGVTTIASRASYVLFKGPIPEGKCVCHTCDVPSCVNPSHLFLGTQKDNISDMIRKNRRVARPRGVLCKQGHPLTVPSRGGQSICVTCQREAKRRFRLRQAVQSGQVSVPG